MKEYSPQLVGTNGQTAVTDARVTICGQEKNVSVGGKIETTAQKEGLALPLSAIFQNGSSITMAEEALAPMIPESTLPTRAATGRSTPAWLLYPIASDSDFDSATAKAVRGRSSVAHQIGRHRRSSSGHQKSSDGHQRSSGAYRGFFS